MTYKYFFCNHLHHGLTQEKLGSEEVRLAPLAPLPASMLQSTTKQFSFAHQKNCFVTPYTMFLVPGTPPRCSVSYRFRGSPIIV